jgi:microcystin-dependent protein
MAYLGEIRPVGFNFSTVGWAFCDGQLLQISQYEALFALIGTTYGGDGQTTFGLPDLRGRIPIHMGTSPQAKCPPMPTRLASSPRLQAMPVHKRALQMRIMPVQAGVWLMVQSILLTGLWLRPLSRRVQPVETNPFH